MQHLLGQSLAWLLTHGEELVGEDFQQQYEQLIEQRYQGQPIAYIVGYKEFWSLKLKVNNAVLVPRADTETLIEVCLDVIDETKPSAILDLGTGSGAIALALAKERPVSTVLAVDSSEPALALAQENKHTHKLSNADFQLSNWFDALGETKFDLIASNPPYIEAGDPHLKEGDLRFEPDVALIGGGDGLQDIEHIVQNAGRYLKQGGHLVLEHGYDQQDQVQCLLKQSGYGLIKTKRDLNNLPRCTIATWPHQSAAPH